MIQLLGMQISLAFISYYISNLYILSYCIAVCVGIHRQLQFVFETTHLLSRHTCFRRRKAGGCNEGEPTINSSFS